MKKQFKKHKMKKENKKQYNETLEQMSKNKKEVIEFSINWQLYSILKAKHLQQSRSLT